MPASLAEGGSGMPAAAAEYASDDSDGAAGQGDDRRATDSNDTDEDGVEESHV